MNEESRVWSGYWIQANSDPAPYFRKTFELDFIPQRAVLHLCGLGWHELYVNGIKPDDRVLAPTVSQYDRHVQYISYDITTWLRKGKNAIAVLLGNGWYNCQTEVSWNFSHAVWKDKPKMICDLECDDRVILFSDADWKVIRSPILFNQLRNGETYDARQEIPGMLEPDFDDSGYDCAAYCNPPGGIVVKEEMEPCRVCQTIEGVLREFTPYIFICDFGVNLTGWCEIEVEGPRGAEIFISYGEQLSDDGNLNCAAISYLIKSGVFQQDHYLLKGGQREIWHPRFTYHGFQYCQLAFGCGHVKIHRVTAHFIHTDFQSAGQFECSDPMVNRLQSCTRQSYLSNYTGIPTDCPHREKNGWTGDAQLAMETGLWNFNCVKASENFIRILADVQRPNGQLPGIAPASGWGYNWGNGPVWDSCLFELPFRIRQFTGDDSLLHRFLPAMKKYMDYCRTMEHDGLVSFGLGDWNAYDRPNAAPTEMVVSSYYSFCAERLAEFDGEYAEQARKTRDAINRKYYRGDGIYADGQRTALALPLYFRFAVEPELTLQQLVEAVRKKKHTAGFGIVGAKIIPRVLAEYGYADDAFWMLTQTEFPGWGYWIRKFSASTLFESWQGHQSRNHIMFGDISAWFYHYAAGIRPPEKAWGFRKFRIEPCFISSVKWVRAQHETPFGKIAVEWERENGKIRLACKIPSETEAEIVVDRKRFQTGPGKFIRTFRSQEYPGK